MDDWNYTYAGSNDIDKVAWYYKANSNNISHEVGLLTANRFGLYDMSGNLREWCWDWYDSSIKADTPATGPEAGSSHVERGGSWFNNASALSVLKKYPTTSSSSFNYLGFRLARTIK